MSRTARIALVAVALLAALPVVAADARRKPTAQEKVGIANFSGRAPKCLKIWVSTVGSRWASVDFSHYAQHHLATCQTANGITVVRRKHGKWRQVTAGSSIECPVPHVPARIADDLRVPCF